VENLIAPQAHAGASTFLPARFREWADFFPEALLLISGDGVIQAANAGASSLFGLAEYLLVGRAVSTLAAGSTVPIDQYLHACLVNGERVSAFLSLAGPRGQALSCRVEGTVIRSAGINGEARLLLRLRPDQCFPDGLSALNRRVDELTQEVTRRRQVEEALRESEARYRTQVEHAPEAIVVLDVTTGRFVDANENAACLFGTSKESLLQVGPLELSPSDQPDGTRSRDAALRYFDEALSGGVPVFEWMHRNAAGEDIPCEVRLVRLPTSGRRLVRGSLTDIRARKWAEQRVLRLNRLYYILSEINDAILRVHDPAQLYERVCRIAVQGGLLHMAWVGLVDPATLLVRPVAHWGVEEGYLQHLQITAADLPRGRGPVGTAIRERRYDICNDVATDPRLELWREESLRRGYRSIAAFPLIVQDRAIGALTLYATEVDFFKADEIHLMESLANNLAFAISTLEQEERRRRAEETQARLVAILEATTDFVGICDTEARTLFINRAGRKMLGIGEDESVTGMPVAEAHPPWSRALISLEALPTASRTGTWSGETALQTRDGRELPVSQVIIAHKDATGAVAYFSTIIRDITERKRAEEERERLVSLIDNSSDFIGLATLDRKIIFLNAAGRRLTGLKQEADVRALTIKDFITETTWAEESERVLASTGHWEAETQLRNFETGDLIATNLHTFVVRHPQSGAPMCLAVVARDIREQKRLEEQFRQSQKMEAVGRLAGGVAHDFNNLLTVITGYTELLLGDHTANDPNRELLQEIRKASERATTLTGQLLAFSRKQVLQPEVLDLNAVVRDVERMLRRLIGEDINLLTNLDPALGHVRADRGQIEQSLINLVINARDAMPEGGKLTVETRNVVVDQCREFQGAGLRPGSYVALSVKDTGRGMSPETLTHLFEPFFTTKEIGKGTGLGLAMTYGIVKQSGGHIEAISEQGLGSTFHIYLPRVQSPVVIGKSENPADEARPGTETILLVEDETGVRNLAALVLRGHGYKVLEAADGMEALHIVEQRQEGIDLLLTDVVMPGMSGRQLADRVRALRPDIRVLYQSGYTDDAIVHYGVSRAETAFVQKPYTAAALTRKVREALEQAKQTIL
jgi:two-component system, cell cycle sensor histidine kinase and response regulator CckA